MPNSSPEVQKLLAGFPVVTEISVLWGDEDSFAHVNNVAFLRWCETGRVDYLKHMGLFPDGPPRGIGPIVASVTCHYRRPLNYPDTITIGTRVTGVRNSSLRMEQRLVSRALGQVCADAEATIVTVDYSTGKPVPVPDAVRRRINELESDSAV